MDGRSLRKVKVGTSDETDTQVAAKAAESKAELRAVVVVVASLVAIRKVYKIHTTSTK